ncbi:MAG: S-layer homology domain-containing protein, partial [Herbinix sp.]|nr:S-layer homology domain-containing protein [Herbinix sp.]
MMRVKEILIMLVVAMLLVICGGTQKAEAASKYIKVEDFIKYIVQEMEWEIDEESDQPYIDMAIEKEILKEDDFKDYSEYLTRTDCAVIANRLDTCALSNFYIDEVIEFLRACNLFEGRLYYELSGKLYPKGETVDTYDARKFSQVITPILKGAFPSDTWGEQGLRTRYEKIYDKEGNTIKTFIIIGLAASDIENVVEILPFDNKSEIVKLWNNTKDNDRKVAAVLEKRISDINEIPKSKREAVASIVAKGIIKGYSNGLYIQNREFRGSKKITENGAKDVIQKVLHPEKRALISPDGQLIRTTNLPKNAADYTYILEGFPNKYYEMIFRFMYLTGFKDGSDR